MKIDLYLTYYELSHLQSFIPINSKTFWVFDEILSMIEEEVDKGVMKNDCWNLARIVPHVRCSHRSCDQWDFRMRHYGVCTSGLLGMPRAVR